MAVKTEELKNKKIYLWISKVDAIHLFLTRRISGKAKKNSSKAPDAMAEWKRVKMNLCLLKG